MSANDFTFDALREELEKKYAPMTFTAKDGETYTLLSLLRLPKDVRKQVIECMKEMKASQESGDDDDFNEDLTVTNLEMILSLVVKGGFEVGSRMVATFEGDLAMLMLLMEHWQKVTQPGEALPSQT